MGSVTGTAEESHECYVFISNKLASDITLTIGQAFDLAYRRYMTDSGKQFEISKLQSHNKILEGTVQTYRERLREVAEILSKPDLDKLLLRLGVREICEVQVADTGAIDGNKTPDLGEIKVECKSDAQLLNVAVYSRNWCVDTAKWWSNVDRNVFVAEEHFRTHCSTTESNNQYDWSSQALSRHEAWRTSTE